MKLNVEITKEILNRSANCSGSVGLNCAIGLAIYEIFGGRSWVETDLIVIQKNKIEEGDIMLKANTVAEIELPQEAQDFIADFDQFKPGQRKEMQPFSFEIDVPDEVIEMINIDEIYKVLETSTCLKLVEA